MSGMDQREILSADSRDIFKAASSVIGNEERVNVERISRKFHTSIYTDLISSNISGIHRTQFIGPFREIHRNIPIKQFDFIYNFLTNKRALIGFKEMIVSGSRSEGFDFQSSDYDTMMVIDKICGKQILFDVEADCDYPGFVRLKILSDLEFPFKEMIDNGYLSSKLFMETIQNLLSNVGIKSEFNGPCISLPEDFKQNDFAFVFKQDNWPIIARGCIQRLLKFGWPCINVIKEIIKSGCMFVPKGFTSSPDELIQWRMSFSVAENLLVHSMNHSQFLAYGLLKLTLKYVIDVDPSIKGLLCSYFLKTAVFWEIVSSNCPWDPSNLVHNFWRCILRILGWVQNEYCPNFFVPENNMFQSKIHGNSRQLIIKALKDLYQDKDFDLKIILRDERPQSCTKSSNLMHLVPLLKIIELYQMGKRVSNEKRRLAIKQDCEYSNAMHTLFQLTDLNEAYLNMLSSSFEAGNQKHYKEKKLVRLLKLSSPYKARGYIYIAYHFYICKRYEDSIRLLTKALTKLTDPNTVYRWDYLDLCESASRNFTKYRELDGNNRSILYMMRRHVAAEICLNFRNLTGHSSERINYRKEAISPLVFSHFLMFMCHFRRDCMSEARASLQNIQKSFPTDIKKENLFDSSWELSEEILRIAERMYKSCMR